MAFVPLFGTGYESGTMAPWAGDSVGCGVNTIYAHTGTYSLWIGNSGAPTWVRYAVAGSLSELYIGVWIFPRNFYVQDQLIRIQVVLSDGLIVEVRQRTAPSRWDAYVNGVNVAVGSVGFVQYAWHNLQVKFSIADAGTITTKVEGIDDINYAGDTKPGASATISYARIYGDSIAAGWYCHLDDFIFGTGGWPGDIRFEKLVPNADTAVADWTPSAGVDNYAMVDEVPASDADYVTTQNDGDQDLYELTDFTLGEKVPMCVMQWTRARKEEADAHQLKQLLKSGVTLSTGPALDLSTGYRYYWRMLDDDPNTSAEWTDAALDALQIGQEAVIV